MSHTIGGSSTITVEGAGPTASRSFSPPSVSKGGNLEVTITAGNYGFGGQIVETLPSGFEYVSSDPAGATFDSDDRTVTFTLVDETTFKYTVTAPSRDVMYSFSGVLMDSDRMSHTIGGSSRVDRRHTCGYGHAATGHCRRRRQRRGRVAERPRPGLLPRPHLPHDRPRPRPCLPRRLRQRRGRPRLRPCLPRRPRLRPRLPRRPCRRRWPLRRLRRDFRQLATLCHSGWSRWRSSVCYWPSEEGCCLRVSCLGRRTHTRGTGRVCGASRQI